MYCGLDREIYVSTGKAAWSLLSTLVLDFLSKMWTEQISVVKARLIYMFKTKHILEGIGPDGKGFCVSKDARGFIIKCGHQKQTAIRLPAEFSEAEINISSISERIHSYLLFKENNRKMKSPKKISRKRKSSKNIRNCCHQRRSNYHRWHRPETLASIERIFYFLCWRSWCPLCD